MLVADPAVNASLAEFDPFSPRWRADPYPIYRRLRDEAPVHYSPASKVYSVSRYDDVQFVLKSDELFSSSAMFTALIGAPLQERISWGMIRFALRFLIHAHHTPRGFIKARKLISEDGETHTAMRGVVNRGFTPRRIAALEGRVREIAEDCVAKLRGASGFDLVRELSMPLPVTVIAELLGVEASRRDEFKHWSDAIVERATGAGRADPFQKRYSDAILGMHLYISGMAKQRRRAPAEDLISAVVGEQDGAAALNDLEVVFFVVLLLVAGNETTTNLIGNAVKALFANPEQLARVATQPELVEGLVEETLRFDAPVQLVLRTATQDVQIAGTVIPAGALVAPLIGSANRDERHFEDPDRFDIARDMRGHLGFGFGRHFCLGASLARLEANTALAALLPELPRLRLTAEPEPIDSFLVRGPRALELAAR
jgi:cytochrome P450